MNPGSPKWKKKKDFENDLFGAWQTGVAVLQFIEIENTGGIQFAGLGGEDSAQRIR